MPRAYLEYRLKAPVFLAVLATVLGGAAVAEEDGQWTMPGKNYASTRYSGLDEINAKNAKGLHPVWTFSTGVLGGHQGQPLVVKNTMYVVTPYPNVLYAFDLSKEGYPLRWKYRPAVSPNAIGISCCGLINRGASYADGKIIYNLLDGHTVAVDAETGREVWMTQIADMSEGETTPMAPLVTKDRVIVGASGGEFGIYGWLKGLDLETGKIVWTGHNLGPDAEVLAKPGIFNSHYDSDDTELASKSWPKDAWKEGGGPVWGWISYDPDLDLLFYGAGNPGPYNTEQRPGDNKWTNSVLARRPSDGSLVWAYQFTPHDSWDYDATSAMMLVDQTIGGKARKVIVTFNKNGFQYTLDRATGEVLAAKPYVHVNWAKGVDLKTGRPDGRSHEGDRRFEGNGEERLPEPGRWSEPGGAGRLLAAHRPLLHVGQQPVHGLRFHAGGADCRDALPGRGHAVPPRARVRKIWGPSSHGTPRPGKECGNRRSRSLPGAAPWSPRATWRSTAPWTAISSRSTQRLARCFRSSRWAPAWWATRSRTAAPTASSTWPFMQGSAVTPIYSRGTWCRAIRRMCDRRATL